MRAVVLLTDAVPLTIQVCGMPVVERMLHTLQAAGVREAFIAAPAGLRPTLPVAPSVPGMKVLQGSLQEAISGQTGLLLLVDGDVVLDERIVELALGQSRPALFYDSEAGSSGPRLQVNDDHVVRIGQGLQDAGGAYIGLTVCPASWLRTIVARESWPQALGCMVQAHSMHTMDMAELAIYVPSMRRAVKPFWCRVRSPADAERCKSLLVESAQKGTLDVVAWYVNRPIENWIVRRIADLPVTPNQVSLFTNLVAYGVPALFLTAYFLPGVLLALVVNVLDGVDGKLARVKGLTSYVGELEHSFDLLYEQAWYLSFYWALYLQTHNLPFLALGAVMVLLDSFSRHCSTQFKLVTGVSLADYAPFDRWFRRLDGRRNIYSVHLLVAVLAGWPMMAAWSMVAHAALTAGVYAWRAAKHLRRMDLGHGRAD